MNEKQGEHLDQCIRQAIAGLPEGPPPGSSFDAARLWEQIRPELVTQPVAAKKRVGGWWLAAASVVGLLVGLWWFKPFSSSPGTLSAQHGPKQTKGIEYDAIGQRNIGRQGQTPRSVRTPGHSWQTLETVAGSSFVEIRNQIVHQTKLPSSVVLENQVLTSQQDWPDSPTEYHSVGLSAQPTLPESTSLSSAISTTKPTVAGVPKRRFRVVHENELMAEEEAHRVRYANEDRTDRFVRLGTTSRPTPASDDDSPALTLPLNRKSTQ